MHNFLMIFFLEGGERVKVSKFFAGKFSLIFFCISNFLYGHNPNSTLLEWIAAGIEYKFKLSFFFFNWLANNHFFFWPKLKTTNQSNGQFGWFEPLGIGITFVLFLNPAAFIPPVFFHGQQLNNCCPGCRHNCCLSLSEIFIDLFQSQLPLTSTNRISIAILSPEILPCPPIR